MRGGLQPQNNVPYRQFHLKTSCDKKLIKLLSDTSSIYSTDSLAQLVLQDMLAYEI